MDGNVQREAEKKLKCKSVMYRDTANLGHAMCGYASNDWSYRNGNGRLKGKFGSHAGK
jgi:hypothetical protein